MTLQRLCKAASLLSHFAVQQAMEQNQTLPESSSSNDLHGHAAQLPEDVHFSALLSKAIQIDNEVIHCLVDGVCVGV